MSGRSENLPGGGRVIPYGGSRRGWMYAGKREARLAEMTVVGAVGAVCGLDGGIEESGPAEVLDAEVFALAAGPGVALGRFLLEQLPYGWVRREMLAARGMTVAQGQVVAGLGIAARVLTLEEPRRFARVERCAGRGVGPEYAAMMARLRAPAGVALPFAVAVLPAAGRGRFALSNRASLAAWLRARRFLVLPPEEDFDAAAAALGRADLVLIADGAQAGLLGLCQPGCHVLEVAPEGWTAGLVRGLCGMLGLRWALFFGGAPSYPLLRGVSFGAVAPLAYEVPIPALGQALREM